MWTWGKLTAEPLEAPAPPADDGRAAAATVAPPGSAPAPAPQQGDAAGQGDAGSGDKSLPDPTLLAALWTVVLFVVAIVLALVLNGFKLTADEFDPSHVTMANFALFAGFYVGAQVIERLMEFVAPVLPPEAPAKWLRRKRALGSRTDPDLNRILADPAATAAQIKADRAKLALGVAAVMGVAASCLFGLFFLKAIGMHVSHTVDSILTGITIAAGTKPLHDFITSLQNKNTP